MKSICTSVLFSAFFVVTTSYGQERPETVEDSITVFYSALLNKLESKYLHREDVDWGTIKRHTLENALKAKNLEASLKTASKLFDTIGCNHCGLFSGKKSYESTLKKPLVADDFSEEFQQNLEKKSSWEFSVKLINKNIGYINMPGMLLINLSQDSLNIKTQEMYDKIANLKKKEKIEGWVIDLRFNIGGNAYVMLASLHALLGDTIVYKSMDDYGKIVKIQRLDKGGFYSGEELKTKVETSTDPDVTIPVALITSKMTGSAGEDVAVAFKNRKNVLIIGRNTYGFLTGNDMFKLPFNRQAAITLSYIVDAKNKYRAYITPDVKVVKKDNFEELSKDENIIKAVAFIRTIKE